MLLARRKHSKLIELPMHDFPRCQVRARLITLWILLLSFLPAGHNATGARRDTLLRAAHTERGKQVAQRYEVYDRRLAEYYAALAAAVKKRAPELLAHLQPPGPVLNGYQVLPPILLNEPDGKSLPTTVAYSWPWTDQLIDRGLREIARSEALLRPTKINPRQNKEVLERLALDYLRLSSQRSNINSHIQYNRLWQTAIAADRAGYDHETSLQDAVLEHQKIADQFRRMKAASKRSAFPYKAPLRLTETSLSLASRAASLTQRIDAALSPVNTPDFVNVENRAGAWIIHVPLFTDIEDHEFVQTVKQIIENTWQATDRNTSYRIQLDVSFISSEVLYPHGDKPMASHKLDARRHLAHFPAGGGILTTGGLTTHVQDDAIILGAQAVTPRVLAHEFGHILGFRDRYVRGYKNLGEDGFLVMEVVADPQDIMAATPYGAVYPRHFEKIINHTVAHPRLVPASKLTPLPRTDQKREPS